MKVSQQSRETMLAAATAGKEAAIDEVVSGARDELFSRLDKAKAADEVVSDLTKMLQGYRYKVKFIGKVENVYVFDEMKELQKIIVHHDPVYDCGDFWFNGVIEEYNL